MIVSRVELGEIQSMRDVYRHEMHCQIIFDSVHVRPGWSPEPASWLGWHDRP
jgi:hypothetical protein